jgi:hypothetical protein
MPLARRSIVKDACSCGVLLIHKVRRTGGVTIMIAAQEVPFGADEQLGIAEVLQVIGLRGRTGQLLLAGERGRALLEFSRGRLVKGDLLPVSQTEELAQLSPDARRQARRADLQRTLVDVLDWPSGRATFQPLPVVAETDGAFEVDMLLIEAVRSLDEWQNAAAGLPSPGDCFVWVETPPAVTAATPLTELQRQLLPLCNGRMSVAELARRLHVGDLDVLKSMQDLLDRQFVRRDAETEQSQSDVQTEAILNRRAVELQVRTAAITPLRRRDRQVQTLVAVVVDAVNTLLGLLRQPVDKQLTAGVSLTQTLAALQAQYSALELVSLSHGLLETGDLVDAHASLSGKTRDDFYMEAIDGLYDFLLQLSVSLVEDHISGRVVAERVRSMLGALLLEIETTIHLVKPPAALAPNGGLSALRQKHFHLIA